MLVFIAQKDQQPEGLCIESQLVLKMFVTFGYYFQK